MQNHLWDAHCWLRAVLMSVRCQLWWGTNSTVPAVLEKGGRNHRAHVPVDLEAGGAGRNHHITYGFPKKMALRRELRPHRTHKDADLAEKFPSLKNSEGFLWFKVGKGRWKVSLLGFTAFSFMPRRPHWRSAECSYEQGYQQLLDNPLVK